MGGGGAWPGTSEAQAPPVWRAPEGPEGMAGLRGRTWLRHPWAVAGPGCGARGRWQRLAAVPVGGGRAWLRHPWTVAGPGRTTSRRAERSSRRGRLAGGPPPTAQPGPTAGSDGARNTSGATDTDTNTDTTKRAGTIRFRPALNAQWRSAARDNCRQRTTGQ